MPAGYQGSILETIRAAAALQRKHRFRISLNAVINPETLADGPAGLEALLAFCSENRLLISFSPQSFNNWPRYELLVSEAYKAFVGELIRRKKQGAPILG